MFNFPTHCLNCFEKPCCRNRFFQLYTFSCNTNIFFSFQDLSEAWCKMIVCEENCTLLSATSLVWNESVFVLVASCTTTVAAALNIGLFASIIVGGVATKHPITLQLCACAMIACAALSCQIHRVWNLHQSQEANYTSCRALGLAALFSHCAFVTLLFMEVRFSNCRAVIRLLALISWCVTAIITLAAGINCSPSTTMLVFCFYVLHVPLIALIIANQIPPRSVSPLGLTPMKPLDIRRIVPQVFLFFAGTMPQAFITAVEAFELKPFRSADAWCCLLTALFGVFRPLIDAFIQPELGDVTTELIATLFRRKSFNSLSQNTDLQWKFFGTKFRISYRLEPREFSHNANWIITSYWN